MNRYLGKADFIDRVRAAAVFVPLFLGFAFLFMGAWGLLDFDLWLNPCGFKQEYGLPCPGCYMTTSAAAFLRGDLWRAFYVQPAGAIFFLMAVFVIFLTFIEAVFGVYFRVLRDFLTQVKIRYMVLAMLVIWAAGWMVTLARAFAAGN